MKKGILIDVTNQTITEIKVKEYKDIYRFIGNGCNLFCVPVEFENMDTLFSDDEGLLHEEVHGCFMMEDWNSPLVGNAVILGSDEEGECLDCKTSIEELKSKIKFYSKEVAEKWRELALNTPPQIFSL